MKTTWPLIIALALVAVLLIKDSRERFYNVIPTRLIDAEYVDPSNDPWAYWDEASQRTYARVGDLAGVDLNCNNVTIVDLVHWIQENNPHLLHQYVYRFDPSINIYNPNHAPRVLKELLRNLPTQHKFIPIIRKCFPAHIRV